MDETSRAHVFVSGRVQGVFFRAEAAQRAGTRGVGGWIKNLLDGRVEAVFEGRKEAVQSMIEWCRRGPSLAEVTSVEVGWEEPAGEENFRAV